MAMPPLIPTGTRWRALNLAGGRQWFSCLQRFGCSYRLWRFAVPSRWAR